MKLQNSGMIFQYHLGFAKTMMLLRLNSSHTFVNIHLKNSYDNPINKLFFKLVMYMF